VKIENTTKKTILAEHGVSAVSFLARTRGLLGKKSFPAGQALIIAPCNSIHTFFMQFPIDVLFLDKDGYVVAAISSMQPYRISSLYYKAVSVVELPSGTISSSNTTLSDHINISKAKS
jgi:uncharacterized protein